MPSFKTLATGLSLLYTVAAQTSTSCNPTEKTCPSDEGLNQSTYTVNFTQGASDDWNMTYGSVSYDDTNGAAYTITESGDAPTMQSNFYVFFGVISVVMKTAPGTGIVSCAILESDDLDEIDWEWLGGTSTQVETNYFGKGNTTTYDRATYVDMADSQSAFHNYTIVWTEESVVWMIDGASVRTLNYADALDGANYPQTPMRVRLGIWAGGDSSNSAGTIEWAGGATDYSDGPFTAYVQSVSITNYNPASTYTYGDTTGSYESIELDGSSSSSSTTTSSSSSSTATSTASSSSSSSSKTSSASTVNNGASSTSTSTTSSSSVHASSGSSSGSSSSSSTSSTSSSSSSSSGTGTTSNGSEGLTSSNSTSNTSGTSSNSTASSSSSSSSSSGTSSAVATAGATTWGPSMMGISALLGTMGFAFIML